MSKRFLLLILALVFCFGFGITAVLAGSATVDGTIDVGDPTLPVVFITTPNCTGQGATPVLYEVHPFTVDADGVYNFSATSAGGFASLYLFAGSFNPANPFPTCVAADNSGNPVTFSYGLTAGTTYFAVPFDDTFDQLGGDYSLTVDGPGNIYFGNQGVCTNPLPTNSVVYDVPAGAPAFFAPDLASQVNFNLPAGTWWISEFSGDFAKVWIACQANSIWIPANAVGAPIG